MIRLELNNFQINEFIDTNQKINSKTTFITGEYLKTFSKVELNAKTENYVFGDNKSSIFSSSVIVKLKNNNNFLLHHFTLKKSQAQV